MNGRISAFVCLFAFLTLALPPFAKPAPPAESAVAATVGDDPVEVAEAQRMMDAIFPDKKPAGDLLPMAQAQVLEEIVNRRLVLAYARRVGETPSAEELAKAKKELQIRLAAQGRKVSDVLKAESITAADLERQVLWRLVWDRYLAKYRTPQPARPGSRITIAIWTARNWSSATSCFALPPGPARRRSKAWRSRPNRSARRSCPARSTSPRPRKILRRSQRQARRPARQDRPPRSNGRVVFPGGFQAEGRRDQPARFVRRSACI